MTNPLIAKYEEIYGKKEESKKVEYELPRDYFKEQLKELRDTSTIPCVPPQSVATSNTGITAANPYPKLTSYDTHSENDSFLQIAEKVKNKDARVTSVSYIQDCVGVFSTGLTTITFEVQVWDTP
jgi:hypothetical protein